MSRSVRTGVGQDFREDPEVIAARTARRRAEVAERCAELGWTLGGDDIAYKSGVTEIKGHDADHVLKQVEGYEVRQASRKHGPAPAGVDTRVEVEAPPSETFRRVKVRS